MYLIYTEHTDTIDNFVRQTLADVEVITLTASEQSRMLSQGEKLTELALDFMSMIDRNHMFFRNHQIEPALVVFAPYDLEKINQQLLSAVTIDSVYFNDVMFNTDTHWMLGSVQSVLKILKSADKILNLNAFNNGTINADIPSGMYFQFPWFAHRVGLKVYDIQ